MSRSKREIQTPAIKSKLSLKDIEAAVSDVKKAREQKSLPEFKVGDTVDVYLEFKDEDGKKRTQVVTGKVIAKKGTGVKATFTVRRISNGVGVEHHIPVNSPNLTEIKVKKKDMVLHTKLHFLRGRWEKQAGTKHRNAS